MEFKPKIEQKVWSKEIELKMLEQWEKEWDKLYAFDPNTDKKVFVIDTPPPYPGPFWHIGAAISYSYHDFVARAYRMLGFAVLYPMGMDRNGLPVEGYVEKYEGINMWEVPREVFVEKCSHILDRYCERMTNIMKRLLFSADFNKNFYYTDSEEYRRLTQATFIEVWKKGLIYEADRPTNYCPHCKTTIADNEVEYKKVHGKLYYIKFKVKETGDDLIIATTRPELLGACGLVIYNPEDERYKKYEGMHAVVPLYDLEVPVKPRNEAKPEFGTGAMMVCSFGDIVDVRIFREEGIKPHVIINQEGRMTDDLLKGLKVKEARKEIVELLKEKGLIIKEEEIEHDVPVHERCKNEIEIISMKEYYLKQMDFLDVIRKFADEMTWHPEQHKQRLIDWINSVAIDWPISRRRYYGTEIPIWTCEKCGYKYVPEPGKYYRPWKERPSIDKCPKCGANDWRGETRVLDTWFDSSISILFITKYLRDEEFFKKTFINSIKLRPQGYEIIRTWLYYTLLRVYQLTGKRAFEHVMINGMGLDAKGRKMSKSLGNVIYPEDIIEKYGAEPLRLWISMECVVGSDYRISEQKIAGMSKFLTKILNIARFISQFPQVEKPEKLEATDLWILSELHRVKNDVKKYYERMEFHLGMQTLYRFIWDVFASHYIELVKKRANLKLSEERAKSAWFTLYFVLREILKMLAPIIPATTDFIYRQLYNKTVHLETFGDEEKEFYSEDLIKRTEKLLEFDSTIWNKKKSEGKSLKSKIKVEIPEELAEFKDDLVLCHNIVS